MIWEQSPSPPQLDGQEYVGRSLTLYTRGISDYLDSKHRDMMREAIFFHHLLSGVFLRVSQNIHKSNK